uniref:Uncharacterized protein n=1 Tax=Glossina palpalis gambiensis TaxID=67801 RepID=A0A1B0BT21_9MUSC
MKQVYIPLILRVKIGGVPNLLVDCFSSISLAFKSGAAAFDFVSAASDCFSSISLAFKSGAAAFDFVSAASDYPVIFLWLQLTPAPLPAKSSENVQRVYQLRFPLAVQSPAKLAANAGKVLENYPQSFDVLYNKCRHRFPPRITHSPPFPRPVVFPTQAGILISQTLPVEPRKLSSSSPTAKSLLLPRRTSKGSKRLTLSAISCSLVITFFASLSGKTIRPSPTAPEISISFVSVSLVFDESLSDFLLFFFKGCSPTSSLPNSIRALAKTAILLVSPMQFLAIQQYVPSEFVPLTASHVYVPKEVGSSALAVKANISPALISFDDSFTFTSVELRISTNSLVRVPTLTDKSTKRLKNIGGSSPVDLSSITSSTSLRMTSLPFVRAQSV